MSQTVFSSELRAADTYESDGFGSGGRRGARIYLDITAEGGVSTLDAKLQGRDPVSGDWVDVPGASFAQQSAVTATAISLTVYPGIAETANETVSDVLPSWCRLVVTVGGTSMTFSAGVDFLP